MFKKIALFILTISSLSFSAATAQQYISFGPVVGFDHSGVTNGTMKDVFNVKSNFNPTFHAGFGLIYAKHEHWGFGGEVLFSKEGFKKEFTDKILNVGYQETNSVGYIRVPLRAYYFFGKYNQKIRPKVYAGPSFGFKVMGNQKLEAISGTTMPNLTAVDHTSDFNPIDLGLQVGFGVNIPISRAIWLNLGLNYYQGLLDAVDDNFVYKTGYNMNQNLGIQAGVLFGLSKMSKK